MIRVVFSMASFALLVLLVEARHCAFVPSQSTRRSYYNIAHRTGQSISSIRLKNSQKDEEDESDSVNMDELQKRIDKQLNQYYELLQSDTDDVRPETVHIVVFNPESQEEQGIHTVEFPKGSGNNVILAFESGPECIEFSQGLKNMKFYEPVPQETNLEQLEQFCKALGIPVKVVPAGKSLTPPSDNVDELSYNPNIGKEKSMLEELITKSEEEDASDETEEGSWE